MSDEKVLQKNAAEILKSEANLLEFDTINYTMLLKDQFANSVLNNMSSKDMELTPAELARKVWAIVDAMFDERAYFKPIY